MIETWILGLIAAAITGYIGALEFRIREMEKQINKSVKRDELMEIIDLKQESIKVLQQDIKDDIKELKDMLKALASK